MSSEIKSPKNQRRQSGQVIIEYVLLLSVAVFMASLLVKNFAKRDENDRDGSGFIIKKWRAIQEYVAKDY